MAADSWSSWNPAAHMTSGAPAVVAPARQRSGTAIPGMLSFLIAAASGGDFRAHPGAVRRTAAITAPARRIMSTPSVHADAVLDDDVVEIRLDPQEHLAQDVNHARVLGVERG